MATKCLVWLAKEMPFALIRNSFLSTGYKVAWEQKKENVWDFSLPFLSRNNALVKIRMCCLVFTPRPPLFLIFLYSTKLPLLA